MVARKQLLPVLAVCVAQGISTAMNMFIFPFMASYLMYLGIEPKHISTYVGVIEGLQAVVEVSMIHVHVTAIERAPHRWLSIITILAPGFLAGVFGLAEYPWHIVMVRSAMGIVGIGGMQAVILGEVVDPDSASQAFGWLTIAGSIGSMSGAGLSGYLAEPAGRVPALGDLDLFKRKPYLLPGLTMSFIAIISAFTIWLFVPETNSVHQTPDEDEDPTPVGIKLSYRSLAKSSIFRSFVGTNFFHKMCYFGCMSLISSAGKLDPSLGGIGMSLPQLGRILSITPVLVTLSIFLFVTKAAKRYSTRTMVVASASGSILAALYFPLANLWVTHTSRPLVYVDLLWYAGQVLGRMFWTMQMIIMLRLYPQPHHRGRATLVSKQFTNLAEALGSPLYGRLFGVSSHYSAGSLGRQAIWIFAGLIALMAVISSASLPEISKADPVTGVSEQHDDEERRGLLDDQN